jgi:hypothetical protein
MATGKPQPESECLLYAFGKRKRRPRDFEAVANTE